jgi:hypothetical protein
MRKAVVIILVVLVSMSFMTAFAAGKLSVTQENFIVTNIYSIYGYAYARIDNVGNKPIKVNAGILEIFNSEGAAITSSDYLREYAEYLQPNEYTYAQIYAEIEGVELTAVDDYLLTITGKSDASYISQRLQVTTDYEEDVKDGYYTSDYMYATVTNSTDKPIYDVTVLLVLLDANGNILFMDDANMYNEKAIMPGSSIIVKKEVSSSFIEAYEKEGLTPAAVDAIAFVNVSQD